MNVVLVNYLERESFEDYLFELFGNARRMVWRDKAHLFRERKVEIEDTPVRSITRLIVNVTIRANASPRMRTVYVLELFIHRAKRGTADRAIIRLLKTRVCLMAIDRLTLRTPYRVHRHSPRVRPRTVYSHFLHKFHYLY